MSFDSIHHAHIILTSARLCESARAAIDRAKARISEVRQLLAAKVPDSVPSLTVQDALKLVWQKVREENFGQAPGPATLAFKAACQQHPALMATAEWLWAYEHGLRSPATPPRKPS